MKKKTFIATAICLLTNPAVSQSNSITLLGTGLFPADTIMELSVGRKFEEDVSLNKLRHLQWYELKVKLNGKPNHKYHPTVVIDCKNNVSEISWFYGKGSGMATSDSENTEDDVERNVNSKGLVGQIPLPLKIFDPRDHLDKYKGNDAAFESDIRAYAVFRAICFHDFSVDDITGSGDSDGE